MRRLILLLMLLASCGASWAQSADDAAFQRQMAEYAKRLKGVKTPEEGQKILAEMMAKQQGYLAKKKDTVTQIKNRYGVEQIRVGAQQLANSAGNAKFENNPLFTKCKVELSFTADKSEVRDDVGLATHSKSSYSSSGKATVTMYVMHYMGRTVLGDGEDAIITAKTSGNIIASGSDRSPNTTSEYSENGAALSKPAPLLGFSYESDKHWSATGKIQYDGSRTDSRGPVKESLDDGWDAGPDNATITHNGNTFVITRTINEHHNDRHGSVSEQSDVSGTFTMTITPDMPAKYEAFFEPVGGQQVYEEWMPEGYAETPRQHGNFIDIKIKVESPSKSGVDFTNQIRYIKWELPTGEVSRVVGFANNAPTCDRFSYNVSQAKDYRSRLADMQLHLTGELADTSVEVLNATSDAASDYTIRVYAFDYGAFAKLTAHVVLADSSEIIAVERTRRTPFLLLPLRDGDSKIATCFKKHAKVTDKKDMDDDETISAGDKYPGDGFTLYEEYRGFLENGRHFRGDPNAKDVMIYDGINTARSRDGIAMYELVLNNYTGHVVKTHHRFRKEEFGETRNQLRIREEEMETEKGVETIMQNRMMNFNYLPELYNQNQYGIVLLAGQINLGYSEAVSDVKNRVICGTPSGYFFLVVSPGVNDDSTGWSNVKVDLDSNGNITVNPNGRSVVITDEYARTIAHEMLHYSHVNHHGNGTDYGTCSFKYIGHDLWLVNGIKTMKLYWESAPEVPIDTLDYRFTHYLSSWGSKLMVRCWQGTGSGYEDCIMRYDDAQAYSKDAASGKIYIITPKPFVRELSGIHLCTSAEGTGVNDANHQPISRYGDAQKGLGNCFSQFCVNDKYAEH